MHVNEPPPNQRLQRLYQVWFLTNGENYILIFNIQHPLNVNHKYNNYFSLIPEKTVGQGIKKTHQYNSRLSKEEWLEKRREFWGTIPILEPRI